MHTSKAAGRLLKREPCNFVSFIFIHLRFFYDALSRAGKGASSSGILARAFSLKKNSFDHDSHREKLSVDLSLKIVF